MRLGKLLEGRANDAAVLGPLGGVAARLGGRRRQALVHRRHERLAAPAHRADAVDGPRAGPGDHPGLGGASRGVVAPRALPGFPEHVLEHVGGVGPVADDLEDERVDERRVAVVEAVEGVTITGCHAPDEVLPRRGHDRP